MDMPIIDIDEITTRDMARSLRSTHCPNCGEPKKGTQSFCGKCYRKLPAELQGDLYARFGQGYEHAFKAGLYHLGTTAVVIPPRP